MPVLAPVQDGPLFTASHERLPSASVCNPCRSLLPLVCRWSAASDGAWPGAWPAWRLALGHAARAGLAVAVAVATMTAAAGFCLLLLLNPRPRLSCVTAALSLSPSSQRHPRRRPCLCLRPCLLPLLVPVPVPSNYFLLIYTFLLIFSQKTGKTFAVGKNGCRTPLSREEKRVEERRQQSVEACAAPATDGDGSRASRNLHEGKREPVH